jgi:1-acyl-sn-glycerol-3-phosphate acyltransferase
MHYISFIGKQLFSLTSSLVVILNLGFWMFPMISLAVIRALVGRFEPVYDGCTKLIELCYKAAAAINSAWMVHVVRVDFNVDGTLPDHSSPVIVVNHQSWFDIPILHHVVTGQGPILKFLIKRQLIWVPIVGWICYALNFPRLNRGGTGSAQRQDLKTIKAASSSLHKERGALLIFAEGTRITEEKHRNQNSPYKKLLIPRPGGLKIALSTMPPDTPVVDITINYKGGETNFWKCLHGANRTIDIHIEKHNASDIEDARSWLQDRWEKKDKRLH